MTNDRTILDAVKTILQDNLEDPRQQYERTDRAWIHTDRPLDSAKYPRIQIRKREPTTQEIIGMGRTDFWEQNILVIDIQFWTKPPFKWDSTGNNAFLADEFLVREYLDKIWTTIKAKNDTLHTTYGITGLKKISEGEPYLEPDYNRYTGVLTIRLWDFRQ